MQYNRVTLLIKWLLLPVPCTKLLLHQRLKKTNVCFSSFILQSPNRSGYFIIVYAETERMNNPFLPSPRERSLKTCIKCRMQNLAFFICIFIQDSVEYVNTQLARVTKNNKWLFQSVIKFDYLKKRF